MAKFSDPELAKAANDRLMKNKFVCRKCKGVTKSTMRRLLDKKITCRRCQNKDFKVKRKK